MYVLEPTPRKSWLRHASPATRLLGKFPFGRLNYKYSGGLAAVQRSSLTQLRPRNRRPRPHYPQQLRPHRLLPARRRRGSDPKTGTPLGNPWATPSGKLPEGLLGGLGFWLGSGPTNATGWLEKLLPSATAVEGRRLLAGFLEGQRRRRRENLPGGVTAGSATLARQLLRHRRRRRRLWRQRLLTRLLKRLPQHWRRRRPALGALLERWWQRLEEQAPRSSRRCPSSWGLLLTLRGLRLLLRRLVRLQRSDPQEFSSAGYGPEALLLLPPVDNQNFYWPPVEERRRENLIRLRRRLRLRRLPLTSFHPTRLPDRRLPALPAAPLKATPGQKRRWRRTSWLVRWAQRRWRSWEAFPEQLPHPPTAEVRRSAESTGPSALLPENFWAELAATPEIQMRERGEVPLLKPTFGLSEGPLHFAADSPATGPGPETGFPGPDSDQSAGFSKRPRQDRMYRKLLETPFGIPSPEKPEPQSSEGFGLAAIGDGELFSEPEFSEPEFSGSDFLDTELSSAESSAEESSVGEDSAGEFLESFRLSDLDGGFSTEGFSSEVEEEASEPTPPAKPTGWAASRPRRRRRVDPLQRRRERLQQQELQRQALLPLGQSLRQEVAPLDPSGLAPHNPPSAGKLGHWVSRRPGIPTSPQNPGSALRRRLGRPLVAHLLEEQQRRQAAGGRLGRWLAGVKPASRELQQRQWQQWFRERGLTLELTPEGSAVLGTPEKGGLALGWLEPLLGRLLRRQRNLLRRDRRRLRRRRRLKRRSRRRRRIKARRRRFWRLTHRRR